MKVYLFIKSYNVGLIFPQQVFEHVVGNICYYANRACNYDDYQNIVVGTSF